MGRSSLPQCGMDVQEQLNVVMKDAEVSVSRRVEALLTTASRSRTAMPTSISSVPAPKNGRLRRILRLLSAPVVSSNMQAKKDSLEKAPTAFGV
jgi:hypothetical protein